MLVKEVISIGTKIRIIIPIQRLCASIKTYSTSSGSSSGSSDSSDSDSDTERVQKIKKHEQHKTVRNNSAETSKLDILIDKMMQDNNNTNKIDIAIPLKEATIKKKFYTKNNLSYQAQLTEAAKNIFHKDKQQIDLQLLNRLSSLSQDNARAMQKQKNLGYGKNLIANKKEEKDKRSIIYELKAKQMEKERKEAADKIKDTKNDTERKHYRYTAEKKIWQEQNNLNLTIRDYTIFKHLKEQTSVAPELSVWQSLEQRELALLSNQSPKNVFQEMIQWTESGKLWTFPIDNEYGMEEEHNVHFSEHVFLERHLKNWCPKRGPVRHFMELVCIGLSKNPFMTVDEKIEHITWYKDYFKGKEELLKELGAIDVSSSIKEQIST